MMLKEFTVEITATDYCGFSATYSVMAQDEDDAEDEALEEYLEDFISLKDLVPVDDGNGGFVESCDYADWVEDPDSVETTTMSAHVVN